MREFCITVHNDLALPRVAEPVTIGVPFARGVLADANVLVVVDKAHKELATQATVQSKWGDGSVRWALLQFLSDQDANSVTQFTVRQRSNSASNGDGQSGKITNFTADRSGGDAPALKVTKELTRYRIDTGAVRFDIDGASFRGFENVRVPTRDGKAWAKCMLADENGSLYLKDDRGKLHHAMWGKIKRFELEHAGSVSATIAIEGEFSDGQGQAIAEYDLWIRAFAGQAAVRAWITVRNPRATVRRELGHWPLGSGGSVYFKEVGWRMTPMQEGVMYTTLHGGAVPHYPLSKLPSVRAGGENLGLGVGEVYRGTLTQQASLVQDSSGGKHWFHRSHMNRNWRVPCSYKGYKAFVDGKEIEHGDRADGYVVLEDTRVGVAIGIRHFWQNFPKAVRVEKGTYGRQHAVAALWPQEWDDVHELQGGEQKTHEMVFYFFRGDNTEKLPVPYARWPETQMAMCTALHPTIALAADTQYADSGSFDHMGLYDNKRAARYERSNECSVKADPTNLLSQIEWIDEYGWRNFGDFLADGEITGRVLSHYNLEYDMGHAMLIQAIRTSTQRPDLAKIFWQLGENSLRHESDLDVYHTDRDPHVGGGYNRGKHHHTDHGYEAGRSTHRAYEDDGMQGDLAWYDTRGGGPESGHMGNRGMLTYAWMSGYPAAIKVARGLADMVIHKVTHKAFPQIRMFSRTTAHNIQMVLEGYRLTGEEKYLDMARHIIDVSHPDIYPWSKGFPITGEAAKDPEAHLTMWMGGLLMKEVCRYMEILEAEGRKLDPRAVTFVQQAAEAYNQYGWDEKVGRFAHSLNPAGEHFRYPEPWWDLKVLDTVAWACRWQKDPATRELWMKRAHRNFEEACKLLDPDPTKFTYHQSKCSTVIGQNGQVFLKLEKDLQVAPLADEPPRAEKSRKPAKAKA